MCSMWPKLACEKNTYWMLSPSLKTALKTTAVMNPVAFVETLVDDAKFLAKDSQLAG